MGRFPRFVLRLAILGTALHVCLSGILAVVAERGFPNRMVNVRTFEPDDHSGRVKLIASYFQAARRDGRPLIGFFGSSFTYGYPFPQSAAMSCEIQRSFPDHRIVNAGVPAFGLDGIHELTQIALIQNCRFETLFVEIPVVNELSHLSQSCDPDIWTWHYSTARMRLEYVSGADYFGWFLLRPSGVRHSAWMLNELTLADNEIPLSLVQPVDGYFVKRDDFERIRSVYILKAAATLRAAQAISDRVIAFPTPVLLGADDRIRYDAAALREQIEVSEAACEAVPGVELLKLEERFLMDEELFCNLTHLSRHGNREFGAWLAGKLGEPAGESGVGLAANPGGEAARIGSTARLRR
jgi:hypothetical protein